MILPSHKNLDFQDHANAPGVLSEEMINTMIMLTENFSAKRHQLMQERVIRQKALRAGGVIIPPQETATIRRAEWLMSQSSNAIPPIDRDFEDGLSPVWGKILLNAKNTLDRSGGVRVRGLHLDEWNVRMDGKPIAACFFDLAFATHSTQSKIIIPKIENFLEARLWSDLIRKLESHWGHKHASLQIILEIESVEAVSQAEELLFELKENATGMIFDSKDYASNWIKTFSTNNESLCPDISIFPQREKWLSPLAYYLGLLCEKRGLKFTSDISWVASEARIFPLPVPFKTPSEGEVHRLVSQSVFFLNEWMNGEGKIRVGAETWDLSDFELARCLLWQWVKFGVVSQDAYLKLREDCTQSLKEKINPEISRVYEASKILDALLLNSVIADFSIPIAATYLKSA
jgi:malate synthase